MGYISKCFLSIILVTAGCANPSSDKKEIEVGAAYAAIAEDTTTTNIPSDISKKRPKPRHFKTRLSLYNKGYQLTIDPVEQSLDTIGETKIILTRKDQLVFEKILSVDSFDSMLLKRGLITEQELDSGKLREKYHLSITIFDFFRSEQLYFESKLTAIESDLDVYITFRVQYLRDPGLLTPLMISKEPLSDEITEFKNNYYYK